MNDYKSSYTPLTVGKFMANILAGVVFLIMAIQVLFPDLTLPFIGVVVAAMAMVDFVVHEMGHVIFSFFGEFITVLGGTLAQIFLPSVCLFLTMRRRQWFYISLFGFWLGQSVIQISKYISDARAQQLELFSPGTILGSTEPIHDWHYLLDKTGLLWADQIIGGMVFLLGVSLILGGVGLMFFRAISLLKQKV